MEILLSLCLILSSLSTSKERANLGNGGRIAPAKTFCQSMPLMQIVSESEFPKMGRELEEGMPFDAVCRLGPFPSSHRPFQRAEPALWALQTSPIHFF